LTLKVTIFVVKAMRLTEKQIDRMVTLILRELKDQNVMTYKAKEQEVHTRAKDIIKGNFRDEAQLDQEVNAMMDDLEQKNPGEFQRYKMFPLLKKRLAKEKGFIV
jgi:hypothetical protein